MIGNWVPEVHIHVEENGVGSVALFLVVTHLTFHSGLAVPLFSIILPTIKGESLQEYEKEIWPISRDIRSGIDKCHCRQVGQYSWEERRFL